MSLFDYVGKSTEETSNETRSHIFMLGDVAEIYDGDIESSREAAKNFSVVAKIALEIYLHREMEVCHNMVDHLSYESDDDGEDHWLLNGVKWPKPPHKEEEKCTEEDKAEHTRDLHKYTVGLDKATNAWEIVRGMNCHGMVFCKGEKPLIRHSETGVVTPDSWMSAKTYINAFADEENAYDFFPSVEDVELCNEFFRAAGMDFTIFHDDRTPERVKEVVCVNDDMGETFDRYNTKKGTRKRHQKVVNEYSSDDVVIVLKGQ